MKSVLSRHGRKTVAVLFATIHDQYGYGLYQGICRSALARDWNVLNLICGSMDSTNSFPYEFEANQLYFLLNEKSVDGLILMPSNIYNYASQKRVDEVLANFPQVPKVTVSEPLAGTPGVFVDNIVGLRTLVGHLYREHGRRRPAFISGPATNKESNDRLEGFRLGLKDCGLAFDERYVYEGNFFQSGGQDGAKHLLSGEFPAPDAILCANDYTAQGVYAELKTRRLRIPEQIAVTGFDNIGSIEFCNPPLTSIEQPFALMAEKAVDCLERIFQGESVTGHFAMPTDVLYRRSCGCPAEVTELTVDHGRRFDTTALEPEVNDWWRRLETCDPGLQAAQDDLIGRLGDMLFHSLDQNLDMSLWDAFLLALNTHNPCGPEFLLRAHAVVARMKTFEIELSLSRKKEFALRQSGVIQNIITVFTLKDFVQKMHEELPKLGLGSFYVVLYEQAFQHAFGDNWGHVPRSRLLLGSGVDAEPDNLFDTCDLLPGAVRLDDRPLALVVAGLFFRENQYGYLVFEAGIDDAHLYQDIATQISSAYHGILLLEELSASNWKLNELSTHDSLTDLYNRRGFMLLGEKYHDLARRNKNDYVLFFADVDGLKRINDTWGHVEGDAVICACAEVLKETFRTADVIARLAGDEFTVFSANMDRDDIPNILGRLNDAVDKHNQRSGKPYHLAVSIGEVCFQDHAESSFQQIMDKADAILYERKKQRKALRS